MVEHFGEEGERDGGFGGGGMAGGVGGGAVVGVVGGRKDCRRVAGGECWWGGVVGVV